MFLYQLFLAIGIGIIILYQGQKFGGGNFERFQNKSVMELTISMVGCVALFCYG